MNKLLLFYFSYNIKSLYYYYSNTLNVPNSMCLSELPSSNTQPKPWCFNWNLNLDYQLCLYKLIHYKKKEKKL